MIRVRWPFIIVAGLWAHSAVAQCDQPASFPLQIDADSSGGVLNAGDHVTLRMFPAIGQAISHIVVVANGQSANLTPIGGQSIGNVVTLVVRYGPQTGTSLNTQDIGSLVVPEEVDALPIQVEAFDKSGNCGFQQGYFATASAHDFLIAVGVNIVEKSPAHLKFARDDATDIVNHMIQHAGVPSSHAYLLVDSLAGIKQNGAGHVGLVTEPADISTAFTSIGIKADRAAHIYFYFSGHQMVDPSAPRDKFAFMLPHSRLTSGTESTRYTWSDLLDDFSRVKAKGVVILDSCYSGAGSTVVYSQLPGQAAADPARQRKFLDTPYRGELPPKRWPDNVIAVITSSSGTDPSWEFGGNIRHGLFTYYLLQVGLEATHALRLHDAYGPQDHTGMARERTTQFGDSGFLPMQTPWARFDDPAENELWWVK